MKVNMILQKIHDLQGMDEFKQLCDRLKLAADNVRSLKLNLTQSSVPLPNLIFAADPGCGVSLHLRLLTDLLRELQLLPFIGESDCFEWTISGHDGELERLLKRISRAGGFYGQFQGVIGLDVSQLLEHARDDEDGNLHALDRLMEYINARHGQILFVFIIPRDTSESLISRLQGKFASHTPSEVVHMSFPREEAANHVTALLALSGFRVSDDAMALLQQELPTLCGAKDFEGYQTLKNLSNEIIWHKLSHESSSAGEITREDLDFIMKKGGYYTNLKAAKKSNSRRRVGFGADTEDA